MIKISVVIPVFNMVNTINKTLDSILSQKYGNLELIVIDANSTDGTKELLESRKEEFAILVSEKDKGQYYAIQKGMKLATGEVVSWLNADDIYFPWTLHRVSHIFELYNNINWIAGIPAFLDVNGNLAYTYNNVSARPQKSIKNGDFRKDVYGYLQQESMFYRKSLWDSVTGLNLKYSLAADFELWTRFAKISTVISVNLPLAGFRIDDKSRSKIMANVYENEVKSIVNEIGKNNRMIEFCSKSNILNKIIRLFIWKRHPMIYYSISKNEWCYEKRYRPISNISFTNLILHR